MKGIIDRYEDQYCVIEVDGVTRDVLITLVSSGALVGDVVDWDGKQWVVNQQETSKRSKEIAALMDDVWDD